MNTRSDLTMRITMTLCVILLLLVACGGLLALADSMPPSTTEAAESGTEESTVGETTAETAGETTALPVLPEDDTATDAPTDTTVVPEASLPTPSDTTLLPDCSSSVPDGSEGVPEWSGSLPVIGSGDLSSAFPTTSVEPAETTPAVTTTPAPVVTTTKAPVVTDPPNYSTMPATKTGALQSSPSDPLSTDSAVTTPTVTTQEGGKPPAVIGTTLTPTTDGEGSLPDRTLPITDRTQAETQEKEEADSDDSARTRMLYTLLSTFAVIAVVAAGGVILLKFIRV